MNSFVTVCYCGIYSKLLPCFAHFYNKNVAENRVIVTGGNSYSIQVELLPSNYEVCLVDSQDNYAQAIKKAVEFSGEEYVLILTEELIITRPTNKRLLIDGWNLFIDDPSLVKFNLTSPSFGICYDQNPFKHQYKKSQFTNLKQIPSYIKIHPNDRRFHRNSILGSVQPAFWKTSTLVSACDYIQTISPVNIPHDFERIVNEKNRGYYNTLSPLPPDEWMIMPFANFCRKGGSYEEWKSFVDDVGTEDQEILQYYTDLLKAD